VGRKERFGVAAVVIGIIATIAGIIFAVAMPGQAVVFFEI
jgi:hypothetical protein